MSLADEKAPGALAQMALFLARKGRRVWTLTVLAKSPITPRLTRVTFSGEDLDELVWRRGQDLVLELPQSGTEVARRHYTIRDHRAAAKSLAIDFVRHGDSASARWLDAAKPGDRIAASGPRGHTVLNAGADWHLFVGDETSIPAVFAMLEGLPAGAKALAFLELGRGFDAPAFATPEGATLEWVPRADSVPEPNGALLHRLETCALPEGRGHAYITGETSAVRALRHHLIARGLAKDQITAEGYWRPGRVGGHDHV